MMNVVKGSVACSILFALGCDVESEKSDYICFNAENRYINEEYDTRPVILVEYGEVADIGYMYRGDLVNHSECAPAKVTTSASSSRYEWFEYGNAVEEDGVKSLEFFVKNNLWNIKAERVEAEGVAEIEYSEKPLDSDDNAVITKRLWSSDFPIDEIVAEDHFDGKTETFVTAHIGQSIKTIRWNENRQQWDCSYQSNDSNFVDQGCRNEADSDLLYIGFEVPLYDYFDSLSDSIPYETDYEELDELVDRYRG
ncbi:hypothetical protein AB4302_12150 [Vibrio breoganii]|nr:hypothetical protein BCT60_07455 [Vibrio breoganii]PMM19056.1 hypothetical protein BCT59_01140 [Vibrio breoganii]